jgi:protein-disulfide isomerase
MAQMETLKAGRLAALLLGGLTAAALAGCSGREPAAAEAPPSAPAAAAEIPEVVATIGDEQITMADIRREAGADLERLEGTYQRNRMKLVQATLDRILRERVLMAEATKQGKTVDRLVLDEAGGTFDPSDIEISAWYNENRDRVGNRTLEQVSAQISSLLRAENQQEAAAKLQERLNRERQVVVKLEPVRVSLNNVGAPTAGASDAKVTLVEFSDFQCPFCARFVSTLKQIEQTYGDRVQIVYRQYPIVSLHPNAFKAAEASLCANEQGKFWQIHDVMFQEQDRLSVRELKLLGGRLGMDQKKFDGCLDSGKYTEQVQNDLAEGGKAGITGTPALFVNGIPIDGGAVPFETVKRAIDRELQRQGS